MQSNTLFPISVDQYLAPPDPHVNNRIEGFPILTCIAAIVALLVEGWIVYAVIQDILGIGTALLLHIVISGLLVLAYVLFTPLASNHLFMALLMISTKPLGPKGASGTLLAMLLWLWFSLFAAPFSEWFQSIFPSPVISRPESIDEDLRTGRDESAKNYDVEPFMDVIRYGNDDQKRRALGKITSFFSPGFAPVLRLALHDESNMIRVQSATAISIIENRFQTKLMKLEKIYDRHYREDPATIVALANFHDDYSFTGILDDSRERANRVDAKRLYEEYLQEVPQDGVIRTRYGRLLLRMGELQEAIRQFEKAMEERLTATRASWLAEAYYRIGDYNRLRSFANHLHTNHGEVFSNLDSSVHDSLVSWMGHNIAANEQENV
ncbi:MAG: tetratricopeptide repeat protein [Alphaproteobacteria bacterium]|nr:tetratricopeptide repeat protein [Alphaproteobacteria bacterium]